MVIFEPPDVYMYLSHFVYILKTKTPVSMPIMDPGGHNEMRYMGENMNSVK